MATIQSGNVQTETQRERVMGGIEILEQLHHLPPFNVVGWVMENDSINMCMQSEMYSLHIIKKLISFYIHTRPTRVHHPSRTTTPARENGLVAVKTCKHLNWLHHHHATQAAARETTGKSEAAVPIKNDII